jgi:hypothetical protein
MQWAGHFCRPPYVAIGVGLSHRSRERSLGVQSLRIPTRVGFLLIVRTGRIVTAIARGSAGYSDVPANSRVL